MDACLSDLGSLIVILKRIYLLMQYAIVIILIILCTVDVFKIVLSKKEEEVKKYRSAIFNRIFACMLFFFVPTIIFFLFGVLFGGTDYDIGDIKDCWKSVSINRNIFKESID